MRTRRSLARSVPLVLTVAASGFVSIGCGSAATDPLEVREPSNDPIAAAPPLGIGDRVARTSTGDCEFRPFSGTVRPLEGCPVVISRSSSMVRRHDGACYIDYECHSPPGATCNPPEPERVACPEGSPPSTISRNPPAVSP